MPNPSKIKDEPFSWEETKYIVVNNKLENFARSKNQTERYLNFKKELKEKQISVFKQVLVKELNWYEPEMNNGITTEEINLLKDDEINFQAKSDKLFANKNDLKILPNHFPYYFESGIRHLCIWSKLRIPADPESVLGDISPKTRELINIYIDKTFVKKLGIPKENVVWFKNWEALQSVKAISHIHVLVKGMTDDQFNSILFSSGELLTEEDTAGLQ